MPSYTVVVAITADVDAIDIADMPALLEKLEDFDAVYDDIAYYLQQRVLENFESRGETYGEPWPALAEATLRDKRRLGYPEDILIRTGRLESRIHQFITIENDQISFAMDDPIYARYHDTPGPGSRLPQRILVAVTDDDLEMIQDIVVGHIAEATGMAANAITINTSLAL